MVKWPSDHLRHVHRATLTKLKLAMQMQESINEDVSRKSDISGNTEKPPRVDLKELINNFHKHIGSIDVRSHVNHMFFST